MLSRREVEGDGYLVALDDDLAGQPIARQETAVGRPADVDGAKLDVGHPYLRQRFRRALVERQRQALASADGASIQIVAQDVHPPVRPDIQRARRRRVLHGRGNDLIKPALRYQAEAQVAHGRPVIGQEDVPLLYVRPDGVRPRDGCGNIDEIEVSLGQRLINIGARPQRRQVFPGREQDRALSTPTETLVHGRDKIVSLGKIAQRDAAREVDARLVDRQEHTGHPSQDKRALGGRESVSPQPLPERVINPPRANAGQYGQGGEGGQQIGHHVLDGVEGEHQVDDEKTAQENSRLGLPAQQAQQPPRDQPNRRKRKLQPQQ